jgi:hypothetical protein
MCINITNLVDTKPHKPTIEDFGFTLYDSARENYGLDATKSRYVDTSSNKDSTILHVVLLIDTPLLIVPQALVLNSHKR